MSRILVVEDEAALSDSLMGFLRYEGFVPSLARTLDQAREKIEEGPELVLLDWMLPDGQGIEILREWRSAGVR